MADEKRAFLFIDDTNIESLGDAARGVCPAEKVSAEPLIINDEPWEKSWRTSCYCNVIYDKDEKIFKMWYEVHHNLSDVRSEVESTLAYAVSKDGIGWEKPILNLIEVNGSKENNLVFPMLRWGAGSGVMKDPNEADPARRYKMLFMLQCKEMAFAGICQPVCVAYSPDGINWDVPRNWLNPVIPEGTDTQLVSYWDPQIRRYVVYLRGRPNVRIICQSESEDFENWTPRKIIVEPDEKDPPQDHEFYGMTSLAYRDFRIGFMDVFHTVNEGWIALNQIEDWMPEWMNRTDVQLTYSKDGRTWHRAGNREPILVCGAKDEFDCGNVYAANAPFVLNDEIWLYYGGTNNLHGEPPRYGQERRTGFNLAKIKKDRLVCLKSDTQAVVTTSSLSTKYDSLWLNADATGGSLRIEVLDSFDRVIPGFSKDDCVPFSGNEIEYKVKWKGSPQEKAAAKSGGLEAKMVSQSIGFCKIRFYLDNAKVFAIYS